MQIDYYPVPAARAAFVAEANGENMLSQQSEVVPRKGDGVLISDDKNARTFIVSSVIFFAFEDRVQIHLQ